MQRYTVDVLVEHLDCNLRLGFFFLSLSTGASLGDQVRQTPFDILAKRGEAASISCSHSIQNYNVILWYKRLENTQLQLLGYRFLGESFIETGVDVEMQGSADRDQTCTLMIKELIESSSGVYFCAASYHSAAQPRLFSTKTSPGKPSCKLVKFVWVGFNLYVGSVVHNYLGRDTEHLWVKGLLCCSVRVWQMSTRIDSVLIRLPFFSQKKGRSFCEVTRYLSSQKYSAHLCWSTKWQIVNTEYFKLQRCCKFSSYFYSLHWGFKVN